VYDLGLPAAGVPRDHPATDRDAMTTSTTRAIEVSPGLTLHVRLEGPADGPPLVLVNSLGSDLRLWDGIVPTLAERYRVFRFDKRGHGLSDTPPGHYRMSDLAGDLASLMDRLATGPAIVIGISIGGMIAQGLAVARPELVRALVLMDTGHRIGDAATWGERMGAIEAGGIEAIADAVISRWLPDAWRAMHPGEVRLWRNMLTRTPVAGYLGCCAALRDADLTDDVHKIIRPTLCLCGGEDLATPPALMEALTARLPEGRLVVIEGSGHLPLIDQPARVLAEVGGFLREHGLG
jgi:3-oxoadipate enol-lactonase